jgi:hypothetical protein
MQAKSNQTLRGRLVIAFGLLGFLLSTAFAFGVHFAYESIEHDLLVDLLERELQNVREGGTIVSAVRSTIRIEYYAGDAPSTPEVYRNLAPGFHEIGVNLEEQHVLVKNVDGVRHMLVFHDEKIERLEEALMRTWWQRHRDLSVDLARIAISRRHQPGHRAGRRDSPAGLPPMRMPATRAG